MSALRIAGYAAIFNQQDRGGDIIAPGAFGASLARGGAIPLLWQHDPYQPVGLVTLAQQDRHGLRIIAQINPDGIAADLVRQRSVSGLSFGYRVINAHGSRPRHLLKLDLVEVSLVDFPMQPLARIHLAA